MRYSVTIVINKKALRLIGEFHIRNKDKTRRVEKFVVSLSKLQSIHRLQWQPTPVFLPGQCYGQRSLVGYSPWGHKELDVT